MKNVIGVCSSFLWMCSMLGCTSQPARSAAIDVVIIPADQFVVWDAVHGALKELGLPVENVSGNMILSARGSSERSNEFRTKDLVIRWTPYCDQFTRLSVSAGEMDEQAEVSAALDVIEKVIARVKP